MIDNKSVPLPIKNGVSPNVIWLPQGRWKTVFEFFIERFPHLSVEDCQKRFLDQEVVFSDGKIVSESSSYQANKHLYFYRELPFEMIVPFEEKIIFENENIVVADKPHFLPVAPTGQYLQETLLVRLRNRLKIDTLELAHRLDRETAGIVLLTKKKSIRADYHALFSERKIEKIYHAIAGNSTDFFPLIHQTCLVKGEPYFRMKEISGEPNSKTYMERLEQSDKFSLYQLKPVTGKKHQLRVHLASRGIPIKNDPIYPELKEKSPDDFSNPLQLLAKSLEFIDPITNNKYFFQSDYSLDL